MKKATLCTAVAAALLAASATATAADCLVFNAKGPARLSVPGASADIQPLAHTVVVRTEGFNKNPIEFLMFPPAIARERFSTAGGTSGGTPGATPSGTGAGTNTFTIPSAVIPQGFPGQSGTNGTTGNNTGTTGTVGTPGTPGTAGTPSTPSTPGTAGTPSTPGTSGTPGTTATPGTTGTPAGTPASAERFPTVGQLVVMSNSGFYGDLSSSTDQQQVNRIVAAALDFGQFGRVSETVIGFQLAQVPATLNVLVAPAASGTTQVFQVAQGLIRFAPANGGRGIVGDLKLLTVDKLENPGVQLQYEGAFEGTLVNSLKC